MPAAGTPAARDDAGRFDAVSGEADAAGAGGMARQAQGGPFDPAVLTSSHVLHVEHGSRVHHHPIGLEWVVVPIFLGATAHVRAAVARADRSRDSGSADGSCRWRWGSLPIPDGSHRCDAVITVNEALVSSRQSPVLTHRCLPRRPSAVDRRVSARR